MKQSKYQINYKQKLGSGVYGTVYTATDLETQQIVAVKQMSRQELGLENKIFRQEVESMRSIPYPEGENGSKYLIRYIDFYQCSQFNYIVMECFKDSTDLNAFIEKKGKIQEEDALQIFYQITAGIGFLHDLHIVHRDIKPSNILIRTKPKLEIRIIDFGFARLLNAEQKVTRTYVGTPMYMSPQTKLLTEYDPYANDVWSLGILLFFMINLNYPWKAKKSDQLEKEMLNYVANQIQININGIPQYAKELILDCLQVEEKARIRAVDLAWKTKRIIQIIIEKSCQPIIVVPKFNWEALDQYRPTIEYPFITQEELQSLIINPEENNYQQKIQNLKTLIEHLIEIDDLIDEEGLLGAFGSVLLNLIIKTLQSTIDIKGFVPMWLTIQQNIQNYYKQASEGSSEYITQEIQEINKLIDLYKENGFYSAIQWEKDRSFSQVIEEKIRDQRVRELPQKYQQSIQFLQQLI